MTQARVPFIFASGETLSPKKIVSNFQQISKDVTDVQAQRYTYSSFVLDYSGIASADDVSLRTFRIRAPIAYEIVGVEIEYYDNAASTVVLSNATTGFTSVSLTSSGTLTTRAYIYKNQNCRVAASTNCDFILTPSAGTVESCRVKVHIRASRFSSAPADYSPTDIPTFASGDTVDASVLNTEFTEIETATTADAANQLDLRIQVITRRNVISPVPTTDSVVRIPSSGRRIFQTDITIVAVATNNITATLRDETAVAVDTEVSVAAGATTISLVNSGTINDTQSVDAPQTSGSDYTMTFARSGAGVATIPLFYSVIYYT